MPLCLRDSTQMDNGQDMYKNRILTYNLQKPLDETNSRSPITKPKTCSVVWGQICWKFNQYL